MCFFHIKQWRMTPELNLQRNLQTSNCFGGQSYLLIQRCRLLTSKQGDLSQANSKKTECYSRKKRRAAAPQVAYFWLDFCWMGLEDGACSRTPENPVEEWETLTKEGYLSFTLALSLYLAANSILGNYQNNDASSRRLLDSSEALMLGFHLFVGLISVCHLKSPNCSKNINTVKIYCKERLH